VDSEAWARCSIFETDFGRYKEGRFEAKFSSQRMILEQGLGFVLMLEAEAEDGHEAC